MTEYAQSSETRLSRILTNDRTTALSSGLFNAVGNEAWKEAALANEKALREFIEGSIAIIQELEKKTYQKHPDIHLDTDVIYIDSGPGPYSYKMLEPGKTDLDDVNYHKWKWSRKMDRARIRTAYTIAGIITTKRINESTGTTKTLSELTAEDFEKYGPYLMYTSVDWQTNHIKHVLGIARKKGDFKIPDSKLVMYEEFTSRTGETKPIYHTEDQMEGLRFPQIDGKFPRRIVMVSHPAHLMRILHILGKYPDSIPGQSTLQLFPIPTPIDAVEEYTKAEIMGTLATVFRKGRASLTPYTNYEV